MSDVRIRRRGVAAGSLAAILAAAVLAPAPAAPGERGAAKGGLAVSADPPVLSPGERRVVVRVDGCEGDPLVATNVGSVAAARAVGPGRAVAVYAPPAEARPQVAIVTAACGERWGWTTLPIVGRGVAIARTEPGAAIRVTIGTRSYGPAVADAEGAARITVDVTPGVRFAYQGERPLDLGVPPAPHAHLLADRPVLRADREEVVRVLAFAVTEAGAPRPGAPLRLVPSAGTLDEPVEVEPGVALARWTLPAGRAGRVRLEARLEDDPGPASLLEIERLPGPPARVDAAADRALAVAGEPPVQLDVAVLDAAGNPAAGSPRVEPRDLVLESRAVGPGRWAVGLDVPERLEGRSALAVSVAAGDATAAAQVPLVPAPAVHLAVEPAAREIVADGRAALSFRVALRDRFGNAAVDAPPTVETAGPAEVATARDGDAFVVTVRPRRRLAAAEDAVTIRGAGRIERIPVVLRGAGPRLCVGPRAGFLAAAGGARSGYLGAEAALWRSLGLGATLEAGALVLGRTDRVSLAGHAVDLRGEVRYLPLVASVRWRAEPWQRTTVLAGAGVALAPLAAEVRLADQPPVRELGLAAGAQLSLGAARRVGTGALLVEARGLWLADRGLDAVRGRVLAAGVVVGWSHAID